MNLLPLDYTSIRTGPRAWLGPRFLIFAGGEFQEWQPGPRVAKQVYRFMGWGSHDALPMTLMDGRGTRCEEFEMPSPKEIDLAIARFRLPRWLIVAACERHGVPCGDRRAMVQFMWTRKLPRRLDGKLNSLCVNELVAVVNRFSMRFQ